MERIWWGVPCPAAPARTFAPAKELCGAVALGGGEEQQPELIAGGQAGGLEAPVRGDRRLGEGRRGERGQREHTGEGPPRQGWDQGRPARGCGGGGWPGRRVRCVARRWALGAGRSARHRYAPVVSNAGAAESPARSRLCSSTSPLPSRDRQRPRPAGFLEVDRVRKPLDEPGGPHQTARAPRLLLALSAPLRVVVGRGISAGRIPLGCGSNG